MEQRSLHRKLAEVYAEVERIPKKGHAPKEMGGYPFVQVGDAADPIRKALATRHLTMVPTDIDVIGQSAHEQNGKTTTFLDLRVTWTISDGESGESVSFQSIGAGADRGDKYTGKALTNAMKYAILLGFLLPTGDDPELGTDERAGRPQTRQNAPRRPVPVEVAPASTNGHDDPYGDDLLEGIGDEVQAEHGGDTECFEHGIAWKGDYGDRYHKKPEGGYCRSAPGNEVKPRR